VRRGVGGTRTIVRFGEYTHKCAPIRESKTMRRRDLPSLGNTGEIFFLFFFFFKLRNRGFTISASVYSTHVQYIQFIMLCCTRKYKRTNRSVFYTDRTAARSSSWVWIIIKLKCEFIIIHIIYNTPIPTARVVL
jgi:hypothetical protein